jgi:site-specific DNA-methyltransferase (adenine-specific)/modification methylase
MSTDDLPRDQIIQGDCVAIMRQLPDRCVDLVFADPPYNLQLQNKLYRPNQTLVDAVNDEWDNFASFQSYDAFARSWLTECRRVLKDSGAIWVIGSYHNIFRLGTIMLDLGFWILNDLVWHKTNPMPNFRGTRFTNATETLIWAKKSEEQKKYTFNYRAMKNFNGGKQMQNVWRIPLCTGQERLKVDGKKAHSTQKPEALLYRVLLASTNPGDLVLDPFFGVGTTGAVAKKLKRGFIGIEQDAGYVALARKRIAALPDEQVLPEALEIVSKRDLPRVPFSRLIESGYIRPGQKLFALGRQVSATVKADGHLLMNGASGSIHQLAAAAAGKASQNGWEFWHFRGPGGKLEKIDTLRARYREKAQGG